MKIHNPTAIGKMYVEIVNSLPSWEASYEGRLLYQLSNDTMYYGTITGWSTTSGSSSGYGQIIYIKAVRSSSNVALYRSLNGTTWTALTARAIGSGNCKIGIICNCGVGDGGNGNCEIDYIRNSVSIQPIINIYRDNTDMTHYLAMRVAGETLYALASTVGEANESALRVRIGGTTYSIKTQR